MVHDHPVLALFHECEAVTRWQRLGFAVLDIRERVVAGVDSGAAINADQLLAECDLETGQDLEGRDEVVTQRCSIRSQATPANKLERKGRSCFHELCRNGAGEVGSVTFCTFLAISLTQRRKPRRQRGLLRSIVKALKR